MPPDTIQLGPLVVSKVVFDVLAPLLGTLVGGLMTYLATRAVENRKWEQQKKDKMQEQRREAIALALEWIAPISAALTKAALMVSWYPHNNMSKDEFRSRWPDLLSTLPSKDIPARLRVLLPSETYTRGITIVQRLDDLRELTLINQSKNPVSSPAIFRKNCADEVEQLQAILSSLEQDLIDEYKRTFR